MPFIPFPFHHFNPRVAACRFAFMELDLIWPHLLALHLNLSPSLQSTSLFLFNPLHSTPSLQFASLCLLLRFQRTVSIVTFRSPFIIFLLYFYTKKLSKFSSRVSACHLAVKKLASSWELTARANLLKFLDGRKKAPPSCRTIPLLAKSTHDQLKTLAPPARRTILLLAKSIHDWWKTLTPPARRTNPLLAKSIHD